MRPGGLHHVSICVRDVDEAREFYTGVLGMTVADRPEELGDDVPEVLVHPDDAHAAGISDGDVVEVTSGTGRLRVAARITDAIAPGAVSISHGWAGANVNGLISSDDLDPLTGMPRSSGTTVVLTVVA